jgi:cobalt/nickel transport system ATP-binding protein
MSEALRQSVAGACPPCIEVQGVDFAYPGGQKALEGVSFGVGRGEFVALVGPNGSGKTTLIKVLLRLLEPSCGEVRLEGRELGKFKPRELYAKIGMVFQNPCDQLFAPTVEEDVAFGPRNLGLGAAEVGGRVGDALAAVDASHLRERPIHHLSFGEQKRVCLAGVLAMRPTVLLMDEPTAGLDPQCESQMVGLLERLNRKQGITIIMATHSVDLLPLLAGRALVLNRGRLLAQGTLEQIFGDAELMERSGLRLPLVAQLFHELASEGEGAPRLFDRLPLTVGQAKRMLMERMYQSACKTDARKEAQ